MRVKTLRKDTHIYYDRIILILCILIGGDNGNRNTISDHSNSSLRNQISSSRSNVSSSSSRHNNHKQSQSNGQNISDKYSNSGQRDRDAGISFISSSILPDSRSHSNFANPSSSSISRGTFDYRSSSAISNSTSSSSGGSFISGLKDLSSTNEKHLRFLEASTQNMQKTDIAMAMSLANTNLGDYRKVFLHCN